MFVYIVGSCVGYQNRKNICRFLQVVITSIFDDPAAATMVMQMCHSITCSLPILLNSCDSLHFIWYYATSATETR